MRLSLQLVVVIVTLAKAGAALSQGYSPEEAERRMTVAKDLKVTLFASEPMIRQAIFVKCDNRGRLWTIQYLQYPNPAGLKRTNVDRWSRTKYDRMPEPPPHGPRGADRITILEDTDGDGRADTAKDFVDGLNLATGVEFGHGGVYVLNPPYLLFYPDANCDDRPDRDPEVLLSGFGIEDAQAMSNHLTWGPDGWLYGVNGSTTTCRIRGVEFQQGVWRFHPVTREFELFCEGGSNCYGLTFDANGELYYSTNGGPFVHGVQGGYYYKSFGKHGPLHNLHAYHYFPELERDQVPGGPPTGGTIYQADALPRQFRGTFIAGNFLGHTVSWWTIEPTGSTVRAKYGGVLTDSHDTWCGPTDLCVGPDGALYFSDFYDQRTAHPDPDANWDRSNGRIYKISAKNAQSAGPIDLAKLSSHELIDLLSNSNHWYADRARVELANRHDVSTTRLCELANQRMDKQLALEGLWALNVTGKFNDDFALAMLDHPYSYIRYWTIRLIGDRKDATDEVSARLIELAANEQSPVVRGQLAATARRLPGKLCMQIVTALLRSQPNETDLRIPWLIWWAIESKAMSDTRLVVSTFSQTSMWANPTAREDVLLLIRRFAAEGNATGYEACLELLRSTPSQYADSTLEYLRKGLAERSVGLPGIGQGELFGEQAAGAASEPDSDVRHFEPMTASLKDYIEAIWRQRPDDASRLEVALRAGVDGAYPALKRAALQADAKPAQRAQLFALLREFGWPDVVPALLELLSTNQPEPVKVAALDVLATNESPTVTAVLISNYSAASKAVRHHIRDVLFSRPKSALAFLQSVDAGKKVKSDEIPLEQLRRLSLHKDSQIDGLVRKHWGSIAPGTTEEKLATMRRFNNDLRAGKGNVATGKMLYEKHCGVCHQLYGQGNKVGPDLTNANRSDRAALLANLVDPSAVIRREFINYIAVTTSGRVLTGVIAEQDGASVTILDANNQRTRISRNEIDELREAEVSLMPERILENLTPQDLRDLFTYLQSPTSQ